MAGRPSTARSTSAGRTRARYLMLALLQRARERGVGVPSLSSTDYINTIPPEAEPWFPGDEEIERALPGVDPVERRDHGAPGAAARHRRRRAHLHLRLVGDPLRGRLQPLLPRQGPRRRRRPGLPPGPRLPRHLRPRRSSRAGSPRTSSTASGRSGRTRAAGLPSYPHPRLMPDFWEFPTVSMGLGPINAIYQAQFNKYLHARGIKDTSEQHVWAFLGDGEMDEPESRGAAAARRRRGARQPHLRRQLQPAAARRPGPRQRQDHPGARGVLPRRRLERHQGGLGPRVGPAARRRPRRRAGQPDERHPGRRLPDLPRRGRRLHPRALLRPRPAHRARWSRTCPTTTSGGSSAADTTTARSTRRTRPPWSTPASRRSSWRRRSRATASARTSPGATRRTR